MGRFEADRHSLIFGNMGPELLNWVVELPSFDIDDYLYWGRVDTDPAASSSARKAPSRRSTSWSRKAASGA